MSNAAVLLDLLDQQTSSPLVLGVGVHVDAEGAAPVVEDHEDLITIGIPVRIQTFISTT